MRAVALDILRTVDGTRAFSDPLLQKALGRGDFDRRDRDLLTTLVRGTLRRRAYLDWILDHYVKVGMKALPRVIQNILRLAVYQILYLSRVPAHAVVNEHVNLARQHGHPGTVGLVNAILRKILAEKDSLPVPRSAEDPARALSILHSHPEWMVRRWLARFGEAETVELLEANNRVNEISLRANTLRATRDELAARLRDEGVEVRAGRFSPDCVRVPAEYSPLESAAFREGLATVQDESEALAVTLLDPAPGTRVWDACSAPGGKASQLAERVGKKGRVVATDIDAQRVARIGETARRLGEEKILIPMVADVRTVSFRKQFASVLVDAPCSGLGVLAKRADARWRKTESSIRKIADLQREILKAAAQWVATGGSLVYSVCSMEPEETWEVVDDFLRTAKGFRLDPPGPAIPASVVDPRGAILTLPHRHETDGAFAVRLVKGPRVRGDAGERKEAQSSESEA